MHDACLEFQPAGLAEQRSEWPRQSILSVLSEYLGLDAEMIPRYVKCQVDKEGRNGQLYSNLGRTGVA